MPSARRRNQQLLALAVLAAAAAGALYARSALGIEWSVDSLRGLVGRLGIWGPIGFVLLVAFRTPLLLPSQLVLIAAGICFGVMLGTAVGAAGLFLSGSFAFVVVRWLGGDQWRSRLPGGFRRTLEMAGSRGGPGILALATAYPVGPLVMIHAAAALTPMGVGSFALALATGATVRAWTYAYFASSLVEGRWDHVAIATSLLAVALLPLGHPRVRGWVRRQFLAEEALPPSPPDPAG